MREVSVGVFVNEGIGLGCEVYVLTPLAAEVSDGAVSGSVEVSVVHHRPVGACAVQNATQYLESSVF